MSMASMRTSLPVPNEDLKLIESYQQFFKANQKVRGVSLSVLSLLIESLLVGGR